ncbi:uncharacterized protein MYCFIDRAFT_133100 [Pseudocercospora fijiensis CIRAD86]|uniref:Maintenance of telomere capping protein 6 n=1 Tax=Pseudocercospora fijiensis (strain CIRAD86) TaxID=383855 RepID=M3B9R3_PSEFD|nr:uncharacterized protein MYCFIDRAFT_133100 [Pseudocercospora fijiensis CIRAD86]EME86067.1 hypothetical protein MYCFIDRAFT_133100 [Pseudocercospora fijiensis CIRAD86]
MRAYGADDHVQSQRDVGLQVPLNFVTYAGVATTAACFAAKRYEDVAAAKCLSNLLVAGYRRLDADVYWDASRNRWSLCPVQLGGAGAVTTATLSANPSTTTLATGSRPGSPQSSDNDAVLLQAGPYLCSPTVDFALFVSIVSAHLASTETDLNATTLALVLNLHAASPSSDPTGSAEQPGDDQLPQGSSLLSSIISSNMSVYTYPFSDLLSQRANLNGSRSWFAVPPEYQPDAAFFEVNNTGSTISTPDGWPSESYVELSQAKRVLVGFGDVDPQMQNYNFAADEVLMFPQGFLESARDVTLAADGNVTSGCFFAAASTSIGNANSSWAVSPLGNNTDALPQQLGYIVQQGQDIVRCGISPVLNYTLNNITADRDFRPYQAFAESSIWSWASGQPINASALDDYNNYRCAALNSSSGFWEAADCGVSRYAACRIGNEPYKWAISEADAPYDRVELGCDDNQAFDAPRTALENAHLLYTWQTYRSQYSDDDDKPLLWLNFNDLDVAACWVVGQNTSCPYEGPPGQETRTIVVPVVGGIIVLVLTVLTICVKCAGNRQTAKRRRRRGDDGWDYEGVPS